MAFVSSIDYDEVGAVFVLVWDTDVQYLSPSMLDYSQLLDIVRIEMYPDMTKQVVTFPETVPSFPSLFTISRY